MILVVPFLINFSNKTCFILLQGTWIYTKITHLISLTSGHLLIRWEKGNIAFVFRPKYRIKFQSISLVQYLSVYYSEGARCLSKKISWNFHPVLQKSNHFLLLTVILQMAVIVVRWWNTVVLEYPKISIL